MSAIMGCHVRRLGQITAAVALNRLTEINRDADLICCLSFYDRSPSALNSGSDIEKEDWTSSQSGLEANGFLISSKRDSSSQKCSELLGGAKTLGERESDSANRSERQLQTAVRRVDSIHFPN